MHRRNQHIKIFSSIRHEAYAFYQGEHKAALQGAIFMLRYGREDLRHILDKQIRYYTKAKDIAKMCGAEQVNNECAGVSEDMFQYIYRHSINTPRQVTVLGRELWVERTCQIVDQAQRQRVIRQTVNSKTQEAIYPYILGQMGALLNTLGRRETLDQLLVLIHQNILTWRDLQRIRLRLGKAMSLDPEKIHPFCELFNIGLLGTVQGDLDNGISQYFRHPFEFDWRMERILPSSSYYIIHPALREAIRALNPGHYSFQRVVVGPDEPWHKDRYEAEIRRQSVRVFLSYSHCDARFVGRFEDELVQRMAGKGRPCQIWRDFWQVKSGQWIQASVEDGIRDSDLIVTILSRHALASGWVGAEWRTKFDEELSTRRIRVIAVRVGDVDSKELPDFLRQKMSPQVPADPNSRSFTATVERICEDVVQLQSLAA